MSVTQKERAERFRVLHAGPGAFVIANAWDTGSAKILEGLGFPAVATSSAAAAMAIGKKDGQLTREEALAHAGDVVRATEVPVSADLENGFGDRPEAVAETVELAAAVGLAGCTAFDVITVLRQKYHQRITGYEVRVEADQAERPPQVFTDVRVHHVVRGYEIEATALQEAIRLSEEKYCSVGAMIKHTANLHTTYEIAEEVIPWLVPSSASIHD